MTDFHTAREFAQFIKGLGFRAFVAGGPVGEGSGGYGFITNMEGSRVISFGMRTGDLSGNYGPPSRESGTGWKINSNIWRLKTADDVREILGAYPPGFCGKGWKYLCTLDQYLAQYQSSSKFEEV